MVKVREEAFKYYFYFMENRMDIFWSKYYNNNCIMTDDPILRKYKFTNVYRVCDRVSQYLIRNVIYCNNVNEFSDGDIILRILIFKVFNRIDTWEYLESKIGIINLKTFDVASITKLLSDRIKIRPIFNAAYLMTGSHNGFTQYTSKHERWLYMIDKYFIKGGVLTRVLKAKSMDEVFNLLTQCPFIGDFLAYQYTIDFNYSEVMNFSENSFVKAGIGAIRGIQKCFENASYFDNEYLIHHTLEHLDKYRDRYGFSNFKNLFGREPTLIDLQNCFCETDKYLRQRMPELNIGNKRIKQIYRESPNKIEFFFPPKWRLNNKI